MPQRFSSTRSSPRPAFRRRAAGGTVPLAVVGCDHRRASTAWRASLLLDEEERRELLDRLRAETGADGLCVLDTCARTEWMIESSSPRRAGRRLLELMQDRWSARAEAGEHLPEPYLHVHEAAARHALRVAVGLESFVAGEREVAGQWQDALERARSERLASGGLNALGAAAGRLVRRVERSTRFREPGRSLAGLAVRRLEELLDARDVPSGDAVGVAVAGMGAVGTAVARLAERRCGWEVRRYNRTVPAARADRWRPLYTLADEVPRLSALVVATGASRSTLDLRRPRRPEGTPPLVVLDLGVPPQVRAESGSPALSLHGLDDLLSDRPGEPARRAEATAAGDRELERRRAESEVERCLSELHERWEAGGRRRAHEATPCSARPSS